MRKRTRNRQGTQGEPPGGQGFERLIAPLVGGMTATWESLPAWVHAYGVATLGAVFREEAEVVTGPKGRHQAGRTYHHWGTTQIALPRNYPGSRSAGLAPARGAPTRVRAPGASAPEASHPVISPNAVPQSLAVM